MLQNKVNIILLIITSCGCNRLLNYKGSCETRKIYISHTSITFEMSTSRKKQFIVEALFLPNSTFNYSRQTFFFLGLIRSKVFGFLVLPATWKNKSFKLTAIKTLSTTYLPRATCLSFCLKLGFETAYKWCLSLFPLPFHHFYCTQCVCR